jgi:hypothetical protein
MMQGMMHGDITGMMLGMGLIGLIQLVVIILGIAALVKYLSFDLFRRQPHCAIGADTYAPRLSN